MSLIKRETSPEMSSANRANSLCSTGPRSARGKEISSQNLLRPRAFSEVVARSMKMLGEHPDDFEQMHEALAAAMQPRDGWEAAWVQDIAILRWRLEHLQRAEAGRLAVRRRRLAGERKRESMPASGAESLGLRVGIPLVGFTGLPDSAWKFQQVLESLHQLQDLVRAEMFAAEGGAYFEFLYGKKPGAQGAILKARFDLLAKRHAEGKLREGDDALKSFLASVDEEIENYRQKSALYAAEHREDDPVRQDADLLLPSQELDDIIRYETHLEDQLERKLRQFYARRREPVVRPAETLPAASEETEAGVMACQAASAAA
jgi:hypothetical protein